MCKRRENHKTGKCCEEKKMWGKIRRMTEAGASCSTEKSAWASSHRKFEYDFSDVSYPAGNLRKACSPLGQSWHVIFVSGHVMLLCTVPDNVYHFGPWWLRG